MLAVVECIELEDGLSDRFRSLGLARLICCFSGNVRNGRQSQSVLFSLLMKLMQSAKPFALAENSSGEGLLDGIFAVMHNFDRKYLCENACVATARTIKTEGSGRNCSDEGMVDFEVVDQDRAACLCALKVLAGLVRDGRNRGVIVSHRFFMPLCFGLLRSSKLPRPHLLLLTEVVKYCDGFVCEVGETGVFQGLLDTVVSRLEQACGSCKDFNVIPASHLRESCVDFALSDNLLGFLTTYSESIYAEDGTYRKEEEDEIGEGTDCVSRLVQVLGKILKNPEVVRDSKPVTTICLNLTGRVGRMMAEHHDIIVGLMECLRDIRCAENASKCLQELHSKHGLHAFRKDFIAMCEANTGLKGEKVGSTSDNDSVATLRKGDESMVAHGMADGSSQTNSECGKTNTHNGESNGETLMTIGSARGALCDDDDESGETMQGVEMSNAVSRVDSHADGPPGGSRDSGHDEEGFEGETSMMSRLEDVMDFVVNSAISDVNMDSQNDDDAGNGDTNRCHSNRDQLAE